MFNLKLFGAVFIIAGSTIGAGMLGLPVVAGLFGLIPSIIIMIIGWMFMVTTGLMLLEANSWAENPKDVNLITLSHKTLGLPGSTLVWLSYVGLFYCILMAYLIKGGDLLQQICSKELSYDLPLEYMHVFVAVFGFLVVYKGAKIVDAFNQVFMYGLIIAYVLLMYAVLPEVGDNRINLFTNNTNYMFLIPFMIIAFGFQNMIPTIYRYLNNNSGQTRLAIIYGASIPLAFYVFWILVSLSIIPYEGANGIIAGFKSNKIATELFDSTVDSNLISIGTLWFSIFAIVTSLLGQGLSLRDFLFDGFKLLGARTNYFLVSLLCFIPPLVFALTWPGIFFNCIKVAGGIIAITLFGILPPLILLKGRYKYNFTSAYTFGGARAVLYVVLVAAHAVLLYELATQLGMVKYTFS